MRGFKLLWAKLLGIRHGTIERSYIFIVFQAEASTKNYQTCITCGRFHFKVCLMSFGVCFKYKQLGHKIKVSQVACVEWMVQKIIVPIELVRSIKSLMENNGKGCGIRGKR